jgi:hypothetical protein
MKPITIIDVWEQGGWSGADHLYRGRLRTLVGRTFASPQAALHAAIKVCDPRAYPAIRYRDHAGDEWIEDAEPLSPGRPRMRIPAPD